MKLIKIKETIQRIAVCETIAFWEIDYLHENLTAKLTIDYLLQLEK